MTGLMWVAVYAAAGVVMALLQAAVGVYTYDLTIRRQLPALLAIWVGGLVALALISLAVRR